ncbi:MAG TPA: AMP-binding protein [Nitrososphaerales archaeon]|nr:AMP-binding protein [Nitrososphaerales archaeon]
MIIPLSTFDFLTRAARLFPERIAVVDKDKRFTYSELLRRSDNLNEGLRELGVRSGDVVSVLNYNTHHMLELYFGLTKTGYVINPLNFRYSAEDILAMINRVRSKVVVVHEQFLPMFEEIKSRLSSIEHVIVIEGSSNQEREYLPYEKLTQDFRPSRFHEETDENALAEILFTSGSTSKPKVVGLTNRNLYLNALYTIIAYRMTEEDSLLHVVPLFHANGGGTPQTITATGGKHVMLRKVEVEEMLKLVEGESITMFVAVPTVLKRFLSHPDFSSFDLTSLRRIIVVGTALSQELYTEVESKIKNCECISAYGMTETGPLVALAKLKQEEKKLERVEQLRLRTRTGYQILGAEVKIEPSQGSDEGEIFVRGNSVFNGYLGDMESDNDVFETGWFHTGDWGRKYQDGWFAIVDRVKDMIKSGGENISSTEIEETLRNHPSVAESAVISIPDKEWGEVPMAFVVLKPNSSSTKEDLREFCRNRLAHFKVPKSIEFLDSLPRTANGKILKNNLRSRHWSGSGKKIN